MTARAAAVVGVAVALLSVALGIGRTLGDLDTARDDFAGLSAAEVDLWPARREGLPTGPWPFFRSHLRPGDRYALRVSEGDSRGFVTTGTVARTFANFALLPSLQVLAEDDADIVLILGEDVPQGAVCQGPDRCVARRSP